MITDAACGTTKGYRQTFTFHHDLPNLFPGRVPFQNTLCRIYSKSPGWPLLLSSALVPGHCALHLSCKWSL